MKNSDILGDGSKKAVAVWGLLRLQRTGMGGYSSMTNPWAMRSARKASGLAVETR